MDEKLLDVTELSPRDRFQYDVLGETGTVKPRYSLPPKVISDYQIIKSLGKGAFGEALLARIKTTEELVVLKKATKQHLNNAETEFRILYRIRPVCGKYLVCVRGFIEQDPFNYLVLDYIKDAISLNDFLSEPLGGKATLNMCEYITPPIKFVICVKLLRGLKVLHDNGIVHRDIKPDNIIITPDLDVRFIDYGVSCEDNKEVNERIQKAKNYKKELKRKMRETSDPKLTDKINNVDKTIKKLNTIFSLNEQCLRKRTGSIAYMSPFILRGNGREFEHLMVSDIYSISLTFYMLIMCTDSSFIRDAFKSRIIDPYTFNDQSLQHIVNDKYYQMRELYEQKRITGAIFYLYYYFSHMLCKRYLTTDLELFLSDSVPHAALRIYNSMYMRTNNKQFAINTLERQAENDIRIYVNYLKSIGKIKN